MTEAAIALRASTALITNIITSAPMSNVAEDGTAKYPDGSKPF